MSEPSFDWCSFFALFWNDKGIKCKINIPDTVLFRYGQLSAWWATNKEGCVQRHASQNTTIEAIRKRFLQVSSEDDANYSKFVTISRHGDGRPQLLRPQAFNQLSELLSDRLECGHPNTAPEIETPSVLQAFIQPYQDVRYVTTLINDGKTVSCHSFQRKYSRRYAAMSATVSAGVDTAQDVDVILGQGGDAEARRAEADHQMGSVDPTLKMQLRKLTAHLVQYIQRAHNLTLGGVVCEYIKDVSGKVYLLSVLRTEWVSNAAGAGAGSMAASALQLVPSEEAGAEEAATLMMVEEDEGGEGEEEWGAGVGVGVGEGEGALPQGQQSFSGGAAGWPRSPAARPATASTASRPQTASSPLTPTGTGGGGGSRSGLAQFPGGLRSSAAGLGAVTNTWPSLQHETQLSSPSSQLSAMLAERQPPKRAQSADMTAGPSGRRGVNASGGVVRPMSSTAGNARTSFGRSALPAPAASGPGLPPRLSSSPGRSRSPQPGAAAAAVVSIVSASGAHVNGGVRGAPLLMQQLQREVELLRDEMTYQHELAEASAAKIRQLEHEKAVSTGAFSSRSNELSYMLSTATESLEGMRAERDQWRERAEAAEARVQELEASSRALERTMNEERSTVMKLVKEYQEKEEGRNNHAEQLESEVLRLADQLKAEAVATNALKRQLLQYSDIAERYKSTIKDGNIEEGMEEVLNKIGHLFSNQANPTGEQYAVQKMLSQYQSDLRAVFLYYAQLDASFTEHWPPSLSFSQWMLFCKDSQTSDMRAGARIRSNVNALMMAPSECEAVFARYSKADFESTKARGGSGNGGGGSGGGEQVLTYELFLAALVHVASRLMRGTQASYLSEGVREYVLKYVSRAEKVQPVGFRKGQARSVLEGTARGASVLQAMGGAGGSGEVSGSGGGGNGKKAGGSGGYGKPVRSRSAMPGGGGGGKRPVSAAAAAPPSAGGEAGAERLHFSGPDRSSSAIMRELSMLGLDASGQGAQDPVRRGGGFDLQ